MISRCSFGGSENNIGQRNATEVQHEQAPMQHVTVGDLIEQRRQHQRQHRAGAAQRADGRAGEFKLSQIDIDVGPGDANRLPN